jgi:hypothetical protein
MLKTKSHKSLKSTFAGSACFCGPLNNDLRFCWHALENSLQNSPLSIEQCLHFFVANSFTSTPRFVGLINVFKILI